MSYTLVIGNKNYSSWSMRVWLLMKHLELPFTEKLISLYTDTSRAEVHALGGDSGMVPVLIDNDFAIWDTLAIIETLNESHPQVWPKAKVQRARARSICGEVHSGLMALRGAMPVNTRGRFKLDNLSKEVEADIARVVAIWESCLTESEGPWLFDEFSAADIVFAPVATRFVTYGVELTGKARTYQETILQHPLVLEWLAMGKAEKMEIENSEAPFRGLER